ncbi:MAG: DNA topoisomerase I [archaeon]
MVTQEFIPRTGIKITTEKEVAKKPSVDELTTIEEPGRPMPANTLEEYKEDKKKRKTKKAVAEPKQIKDSTLIITEKPQAALKIASALGDYVKYNIEGVPYYEIKTGMDNILVASAVGHLFNLEYVKGQKGWPIFNLEWRPSYNRKTSAFTKKYFTALEDLAMRSKDFIVATDFDVEGEVIGWNVLRFICKQKNAKRMKFSTLTAPELKKAFDSPMPELNWGNAYAGEARHYIDWLYGINLSRALMSALKTTQVFKILSIGRIQGPALKIIVDREKEIESFKSVPYWEVFAHSNNTQFKHPKDIFEKKDLDKFKKIKDCMAITTEKEESVSPPNPFDLTSLQREAYRLHKLSPSDTLKTAQKLYIEGLISYPRTSSQKIPKEIEPKKILDILKKRYKEAKIANRAQPVEGEKSDPAHPSIYPTGEPAKLSGNEEKLYNLIVKRFISAFCPDAKTMNKRVKLTANDLDFTASGLSIVDKGWTAIYPITFEERTVPTLNGKVKVDKIQFDEKETQPPKRFSPTSLITLLEKKNLGTKSTRSSIVDTLFNRGYLDGTSIKATALGKKMIESLQEHAPIIINEDLTRSLEEQMEKIQHSSSNLEKMEQEVIEKAKETIKDVSALFKRDEAQIGKELESCIKEQRTQQYESNLLNPCKTCNVGNLRIMYSKKTRRYFISCSNYPACTQIYSLPGNALIKKSDKVCEFDQFPKLLAIRKGRRPWEFCFNPECKIEKEKRAVWESKMDEKLNGKEEEPTANQKKNEEEEEA